MQSESSRDILGPRICQPEHGNSVLHVSCYSKGVGLALFRGPRHEKEEGYKEQKQAGPWAGLVITGQEEPYLANGIILGGMPSAQFV